MSLLGWMFRSVLIDRRDRFFKGVLISGISGILLLHVVNPDAIIAKVNIERAIEQDKALDTHYLSRLSYDATPEIRKGLHLFSCDKYDGGFENVKQGFIVANDKKIGAQVELDEWSLLSWNLARAQTASLTNLQCSTTP
ncbi:MAG: DUF4173 domain-containing protein [Deltaproteobacteria bacterium]|nr:DUF4173 domain-containing protein [Deltaproteobacteria bacterium]